MILKKKSCINEFVTILFQINVKSEMFTKVDTIHYLFIIFNNFSIIYYSPRKISKGIR